MEETTKRERTFPRGVVGTHKLRQALRVALGIAKGESIPDQRVEYAGFVVQTFISPRVAAEHLRRFDDLVAERDRLVETITKRNQTIRRQESEITLLKGKVTSLTRR